ILTTDDAGQASEVRDFDVFGAPKSMPAWTEQFTQSYTGHRFEGALGLVDMGARFYDPTFGMFTTPDPLTIGSGGSQATNPYAYAANNPASFFDPTGLQAEPWTGMPE